MEEGDGARGGFVGEELGEGEAGVVVDGDVEVLPAGAADVIALAVAGDAVAGAHDAGELLDVEVEEFTQAPWCLGWCRLQAHLSQVLTA